MSAPVLRAERLSKAYGGVQAVREVSLSVEAKEVVAMIGPNGAGKSTCFNMLNGQVWPDEGSVEILGRSTAGMTPREIWRLGVGRTFQVTATFGSMTVRENVEVTLMSHAGQLRRLWPLAARAHREEADRLCALVGLAGAGDRPCAELAYGDLKRLELAIALAHTPKLLLMDEPTAGMAPADRVEMMRAVAEIARTSGIGVLFTEHDMDVVFEHADRIVVLDRGRIIAAGSPAEIRENPAVKATYLGEGLTFAAGHAAHA